MTSPWAQSPEAGVESPGPHPAPDSPGTGWGTWWRDRGRNGRGGGGLWGVSPPLTTASPPLLWVDSEPHLVEEMWLRLQTLWLLPSKARIFHSHTARGGDVAGAHSYPCPCQHTHTRREPLFLRSLRIGGGKPYQVISGKIDDDSIIVQILSHAELRLDLPSTTPSHQPLEGHPACSGVPA